MQLTPAHWFFSISLIIQAIHSHCREFKYRKIHRNDHSKPIIVNILVNFLQSFFLCIIPVFKLTLHTSLLFHCFSIFEQLVFLVCISINFVLANTLSCQTMSLNINIASPNSEGSVSFLLSQPSARPSWNWLHGEQVPSNLWSASS